MKEKENISPKCVGFIMDGNRRFAREKELSEFDGHIAGKEKMFEVIKWAQEVKIPHLVFYAFSTENWKRSKTEVESLMELFLQVLKSIKENPEKNVTVRIIGKREDFSKEFQDTILELESMSKKEKVETTIWVALSYGGRAEIIEAVNFAVKNNKKVTEETFGSMLWSDGMPDPDIIIRTGGEQRLSNFLTWQSVYSELFFINTYWPAFSKDEFIDVLNQYMTRDRRVGR